MTASRALSSGLESLAASLGSPASIISSSGDSNDDVYKLKEVTEMFRAPPREDQEEDTIGSKASASKARTPKGKRNGDKAKIPPEKQEKGASTSIPKISRKVPTPKGKTSAGEPPTPVRRRQTKRKPPVELGLVDAGSIEGSEKSTNADVARSKAALPLNFSARNDDSAVLQTAVATDAEAPPQKLAAGQSHEKKTEKEAHEKKDSNAATSDPGMFGGVYDVISNISSSPPPNANADGGFKGVFDFVMWKDRTM